MKKILFLLICLLFIRINFADGQPGTLDLTFGSYGYVLTRIGNAENAASSVAIQKDGKILVAGYKHDSLSSLDFALARYNTNGSIDSTFGKKGFFTIDFQKNMDIAYTVRITDNGKIIVSGFANLMDGAHFAVVRCNSNGILDSTFGIKGTALSKILVDDSYTCTGEIQPDGKILLGGAWYNNNDDDFIITRFDTNGLIDSNFAVGGNFIYSIKNGQDDACQALSVQSDGKIISAGFAGSSDSADFAMFRLKPDGQLDNTFGKNGKVIIDNNHYQDGITAVAIQTDGKIVTTGYSFDFNSYVASFVTMRFNGIGTIDNLFGTKGITITTVNDFCVPTSMVIQSDGKILVGGIINNSKGGPDLGLVRYKTNGIPDSTFNGNGISITEISPDDDDDIAALAMQADGKIIAAGYSGAYFAVARYISGITTDIPVLLKDKTNYYIYPNPVKDFITIGYTLDQPTKISLVLVDESGKNVQNFISDQPEIPGSYERQFQLNNQLPAGNYLLTFKARGIIKSLKVVKQ